MSTTPPRTTRSPPSGHRLDGDHGFAGVMLLTVGDVPDPRGDRCDRQGRPLRHEASTTPSRSTSRRWGWIHLVLGLIAVATGIGLLVGQTWAELVGIVIASLSAINSFAFLPYYPFWAMAIIAFDVFVIWALCCPARRTRTSTEPNRSPRHRPLGWRGADPTGYADRTKTWMGPRLRASTPDAGPNRRLGGAGSGGRGAPGPSVLPKRRRNHGPAQLLLHPPPRRSLRAATPAPVPARPRPPARRVPGSPASTSRAPALGAARPGHRVGGDAARRAGGCRQDAGRRQGGCTTPGPRT